jgi:hypothetical protein
MSTRQNEQAHYARRRERFNAILDHYECEAGDWTVQQLGAAPTRAANRLTPPPRRLRCTGAPENLAKIGRWAIITRSQNGHGHFAHSILDRDEIEQVAGANIANGWHPVCYFDLDTPATGANARRYDLEKVETRVVFRGKPARARS